MQSWYAVLLDIHTIIGSFPFTEHGHIRKFSTLKQWKEQVHRTTTSISCNITRSQFQLSCFDFFSQSMYTVNFIAFQFTTEKNERCYPQNGKNNTMNFRCKLQQLTSLRVTIQKMVRISLQTSSSHLKLFFLNQKEVHILGTI